MSRLCAQGDILIERVDDALVQARCIRSVNDEFVILAQGKATGHHHRLFGSIMLYRDDTLAREIPAGLYVAHLLVEGPAARLEHEEHAPIALEPGTYRVRRQRQLEPTDLGVLGHFSAIED